MNKQSFAKFVMRAVDGWDPGGTTLPFALTDTPKEAMARWTQPDRTPEPAKEESEPREEGRQREAQASEWRERNRKLREEEERIKAHQAELDAFKAKLDMFAAGARLAAKVGG